MMLVPEEPKVIQRFTFLQPRFKMHPMVAFISTLCFFHYYFSALTVSQRRVAGRLGGVEEKFKHMLSDSHQGHLAGTMVQARGEFRLSGKWILEHTGMRNLGGRGLPEWHFVNGLNLYLSRISAGGMCSFISWSQHGFTFVPTQML